MTVRLQQANVSADRVTLSATFAGGAASLDIQYCPRRDFQFAPAPIVSAAAAGQFDFGSLNQAATYWIRGREVSGSGDRSDWGPAIAVTTANASVSYPNYGIQVQPAQIIVPAVPSQWKPGAGAVAGYDAANMGRPTPAAAYRAIAQNGSVFFYVETDGSPIDAIAVLDTNLPEGATMRILGADSEAAITGGAQFATDTRPFRASAGLSGRRGYHGIRRLDAPVSYRWLAVEIGGDMPPGGLAHITHTVFGRARVARNYSDMTDTSFDLGTMNRMRDGSPDAVAGFRGRRVDFEIALMTEAQHDAVFADIAQRIGTTDPVLVIPNSKAGAYLHDRLLYGNLTNNRGTNSNARFNRSISIESIIN